MKLNGFSVRVWLFSGLLIFGQLSAFAHQFEHHLQEPVDERCLQCLVAQAASDGALAAIAVSLERLSGGLSPDVTEFEYSTDYSSSYSARAPPITGI